MAHDGHHVGAEIDAGADARELRCLLIARDLMAGALQQERGQGSAQPAANNRDPMRRHIDLPCLRWNVYTIYAADVTGGSSMRSAPLGSSGATVSALGLGCAALATAADPHAVVRAALDVGMDFLDTSDLYSVRQ